MVRRGRVELATARVLRDIERLHPAHDALAASSLVLARALDDGAGLAAAAVHRELRATLTALTVSGSDEGDDGFAAVIASLSAEVGDAAG